MKRRRRELMLRALRRNTFVQEKAGQRFVKLWIDVVETASAATGCKELPLESRQFQQLSSRASFDSALDFTARICLPATFWASLRCALCNGRPARWPLSTGGLKLATLPGALSSASSRESGAPFYASPRCKSPH